MSDTGFSPPPTTPKSKGARFFPCSKCGAKLEFEPGTSFLMCPYCTTRNEIPADEEPVRELPYEETLASLQRQAQGATQETPIVDCDSCHAVLTLASNITSLDCPFCGSPIVATGASRNVIKPNCVLPFKVPREKATETFRVWIGSLWFAPSALKKRSLLDATLAGVYVPAWTYDCEAETSYRGQRGDAYYVSETVTINGQRQTRQVRKIRWTPVSGRVHNEFDDVLVLSSKSLPHAHLDELDPWDLQNVVVYRDDYLAGFRAECYSIDLPSGWGEARQKMQPTIQASVYHDIGGDEQRIDAISSQYHDVTFKYVLLPVWVSAYRYNGKVFQFLVNARTGEVQGQRPWSWVKIAVAVLAGLLALALIALVVSRGS